MIPTYTQGQSVTLSYVLSEDAEPGPFFVRLVTKTPGPSAPEVLSHEEVEPGATTSYSSSSWPAGHVRYEWQVLSSGEVVDVEEGELYFTPRLQP